MRQIIEYLDFAYEFELSNYRLEGYKDHSSHYNEEVDRNQKLQKRVDEMKLILSEESEEADKIRVGYIHIANGFLKSFKQIARHEGYYPDLSQGMIISGYLLGKLIEDLRTALRTEGDYNPVSEIYMSREEWDYSSVEAFLTRLRDQLVNESFRTKLESVQYYDGMISDIRSILDQLRREGII